MCAIIGVDCKNTEENIYTIHNLFLESKIRGLHATGISFIKEGILNTIKYPLPADKFLKKYDLSSLLKSEERIHMIGHCRYSTSDIEYNQPISDNNLSIVHNGVVTQESYDKWESSYKFNCDTKNDSELIFHYIKCGKDIHDLCAYFPNVSFAFLTLDIKGNIFAYRNSLRPLWKIERNKDIFYASTQNILIRSGFNKEECIKLYSIDSFEKQNRSMNG
jgi:glutamine phosphoribosylpyrophosphate amidotransferase